MQCGLFSGMHGLWLDTEMMAQARKQEDEGTDEVDSGTHGNELQTTDKNFYVY